MTAYQLSPSPVTKLAHNLKKFKKMVAHFIHMYGLFRHLFDSCVRNNMHWCFDKILAAMRKPNRTGEGHVYSI